MTKLILFETYLKETGDLISIEEWVVSESKVKKMASYWDAMRRYGIIGLASYLSGDKDLKDNATKGLLSVPLGMILSAGYKKISTACVSKCESQLCKQQCYLNSCGVIIKEVHSSIQDVKSKTRTIDTKKILTKLDKQLVKWVKRYNHHKIEIKKIVDKKDKHNSVDGMARYYTGSQDDS